MKGNTSGPLQFCALLHFLFFVFFLGGGSVIFGTLQFVLRNEMCTEIAKNVYLHVFLFFVRVHVLLLVLFKAVSFLCCKFVYP